jgi:hypothetical protein
MKVHHRLCQRRAAAALEKFLCGTGPILPHKKKPRSCEAKSYWKGDDRQAKTYLIRASNALGDKSSEEDEKTLAEAHCS